MRGWARCGATVLALAALAPALASCAADSSGSGLGSSRAAYEALKSLGADCSGYVVNEVAVVPYTQIQCSGLRMDWFADAAAYDAAVSADCAAVPTGQRAGMTGIVIVRGPDWVLRGNGEADVNAWPRDVDPADAADRLDGELTTAAGACKAVGAWQ